MTLDSEVAVPAVAERDRTLMASLGEQLRRQGYLRQVYEPLMPPGGFINRNLQMLPGYLRSFSSHLSAEQVTLANLFLFHSTVTRDHAERALTSKYLKVLVNNGLVVELEGGGVRSCHDIYPVGPCYIFTDCRIAQAHEIHKQNVYYLGGDSYELADLVPRRPVGRVLDLCTGSGVHAVLAAQHAQAASGVDINPRALGVSRINALVNGVADRCDFLLGDLYEAVPGGHFDLITANPPFVPTPENLSLFRGGGEGGEEITRRVFQALPERLNPGGWLMLVTNFPYPAQTDVMKHCRSWLPAEKGWGICLLSRAEVDNTSYIFHQYPRTGDIDTDHAELDRWLDCYERSGIEKMGFGTYFARRLQPGDEWLCHRLIGFERKLTSDDVARWLDGWSAFGGQNWRQGWTERKLALADDVILWLNASGAGLVQFRDSDWPPLELPPTAAAVAAKLRDDGPQPAGQVADRVDEVAFLGCERVLEAKAGSAAH